MISIASLWLPILLSAVIVFIVSAVIHMVLKYHANDFMKVPKEQEVLDALRPFNLMPGNYSIPRAQSMKEMGTPEFIEKMEKGPVAMLTVLPNGKPKMGKSLVLWFIYSIVVSFFAAYIASRALTPETEYLAVFRFVGTTSFIGYALALWQSTIWYGQSASTTLKSTFDSLVYALLTAGIFGWLWP